MANLVVQVKLQAVGARVVVPFGTTWKPLEPVTVVLDM
jgi:hypothetical protein